MLKPLQVASQKATSDAALLALEAQLRNTHTALQVANAERRHETRKTTAAMLLTRLEVIDQDAWVGCSS